MNFHADEEINRALIKLCDALCSWERATGRESVLILRELNFTYRAVNGKPNVPEDIPDERLIAMVVGGEG